MENCQRCVAAYEARRRGFDVSAKPRIFSEDDSLPFLNGKNGWPAVYQNYKLENCAAPTRTARPWRSCPPSPRGRFSRTWPLPSPSISRRPPTPYTEDTLLSAMERAGAGDMVNCPARAREGGLGRMPDDAAKWNPTQAQRSGLRGETEGQRSAVCSEECSLFR